MANTVIGDGITIEGELTSDEEVVVEGTIKGTLNTSERIIINPDASVEADVTASTISVAGKVTGNVTVGDRVELQAGGKLVGDVKAARISIADGAQFKGKVDMDI